MARFFGEATMTPETLKGLMQRADHLRYEWRGNDKLLVLYLLIEAESRVAALSEKTKR